MGGEDVPVVSAAADFGVIDVTRADGRIVTRRQRSSSRS